MKVRIYYFKGEKEPYAFTINKDFAKKFEEQRCMNQFRKVVHEMDKYEFMALSNNHKSHMLSLDYLNDGEMDYEIICTRAESMALDESCDYIETNYSMLYMQLVSIPWKEKYLNVINELTPSIIVNNAQKIPTLNINTFKLFYHLFGKTFHKDDEQEEEL